MSDIQDRLRNWSRWLRSSNGGSSCRSLEHNYKSPQIWHAPEPRISIDVNDAILIESIVTDSDFPRMWQQVLKYSYVYPGTNFRAVCRKCKVRPENYEEEQKKAERTVGRLIYFKETRGRVLTHNNNERINIHNNLTLSPM